MPIQFRVLIVALAAMLGLPAVAAADEAMSPRERARAELVESSRFAQANDLDVDDLDYLPHILDEDDYAEAYIGRREFVRRAMDANGWSRRRAARAWRDPVERTMTDTGEVETEVVIDEGVVTGARGPGLTRRPGGLVDSPAEAAKGVEVVEEPIMSALAASSYRYRTIKRHRCRTSGGRNLICTTVERYWEWNGRRVRNAQAIFYASKGKWFPVSFERWTGSTSRYRAWKGKSKGQHVASKVARWRVNVGAFGFSAGASANVGLWSSVRYNGSHAYKRI